MTRRLVLASASPARRRLLLDAGFAPEVRVSGVDEDALVASARDGGIDGAAALTVLLAEAKAGAVALDADLADALVVGCDSMFEIDGEQWGKPGSPAVAVAR